MMRFAEELVTGDELAPAEQKRPSPREKQLALHLVDELSGPVRSGEAPGRVPERRAGGGRREGRGRTRSRATPTARRGEQRAGGRRARKVIDLAELLSRSIKVAEKPGPAKARSESAEKAEKEEKPGKKGARDGKKRASG